MGIFKRLTAGQAFVKLGIYGGAGSGKSTTASLFAIGLHTYIKSKKPIVYMDTETGSEWTKILFDKANIELQVAKERSLEALLHSIPDALKVSDILIIDSITHPYQDMMESYLKKTKKTKLAFQDWNVLKPLFREFTDPYVREKLHIFVCGRSQDLWKYFRDEDTGKMELYQEGTRMRVDKEMGYEPSLLIEMEKVLNENWRKSKEGKKWLHRANILKDRNPDEETTLEGKWFDDPTFMDILPHIEHVGIGGEHKPVSIEDSQKLFKGENGKPEWKQEQDRKLIVLEEISGLVDRRFPSTSAKEKVARLSLSQFIFKTTSGKKVGEKSLHELQIGRDKIEFILGVKENVKILLGDNPEEHFDKMKVPEEPPGEKDEP